jgi:hypothetical protein
MGFYMVFTPVCRLGSAQPASCDITVSKMSESGIDDETARQAVETAKINALVGAVE